MRAQLTNDSEMGADEKAFEEKTEAELEAYLNADPRHAIILIVEGEFDQIAIWRGAGEDLNNFYIQPLPLEEPDASGGDWTAAEALREAINFNQA